MKPAPLLLEGLKRLEYRGYDSAGIATLSNGGFTIHRSPGQARQPRREARGRAGRRARRGSATRAGRPTAGRPRSTRTRRPTARDRSSSSTTASSRTSRSARSALAKAGHRFKSETDTEVFAHEVEAAFHGRPSRGRPRGGREPDRRLRRGRVLEPRAGSPRRPRARGRRSCSGSATGENYVASDPVALVPWTRDVIFLEDGDVARVDATGVSRRTTSTGGAPRAPGPPDPVGRRRRREGRLPPLHGQGDPRAADGDRRDAGRQGLPRDRRALPRFAAADAGAREAASTACCCWRAAPRGTRGSSASS